MSTQLETIVFAGGGSKNPSLMMWPKPGEETKPTVVSRFNHGYSVYALDVSPGASRIAAGTKAGLLQVYALSDFQASENSTPLFEVFHQPGIVSLAFCTDDILASGGLNGNIKIWSVTQKRQLAEFQAHTNGVFALRRLGSLVLASIGGDNILRIWDLDTLETKYESSSFDLPKIRALACLDYNPASSQLMHPSASGALYAYDLFDNFGKHEIAAHDGNFSAFACGPRYVVTAGSDDAMIKLWKQSMDEPLIQTPAPSGVLTAAWTGTDSVITVYTDGSGQIWKVDSQLLPGPRIYDLDLRTVTGLPVELLYRQRLTANKQWRDEKLSQLKEIISDSTNLNQIAVTVNELHKRGFSVEAATALADTARAQKKPLWELESLLVITKELGNSKAVLPSLYALAKLLRKLKEPKLAQDYFKKILQIDGNYLDVNKQIADLQSDTMMQMSVEKDIRGDLMQKGQFSQELEKYTILDKKYFWRTAISIGKTLSFGTHLNIENVANSVLNTIGKYDVDSSITGLTEIQFFANEELKNLKCVYVPSANLKLPVAFALGIRTTTRGSEFVPYGIFDTRLLAIVKAISANEHNKQVKKFMAEFHISLESREWLRNITEESIKSVKQLGSRILAEADDEF